MAAQDDKLDELFLALHELQRRKERIASTAEHGSAYARALQHFERRSARQREDRLHTEALLRDTLRAVRVAPPRVQRELEIVGSVGGTATGRFRLESRSRERVRVEWVVSDAIGGCPSPPLRFEPSVLQLDPGQSELVCVTADLRESREPCVTTVYIETRAGALRDSLWLTIRAREANHD